MSAGSPGAGRPVSSGSVTSPTTLVDAAATIPQADVRGSAPISGVAYRSSDVRVGDLFFCGLLFGAHAWLSRRYFRPVSVSTLARTG